MAPATGEGFENETVKLPAESVVETVPVVLVTGVTALEPCEPVQVGVTVIAADGVAVSAEV